MKTHAHLLVRDLLAELFVEASRGRARADTALAELQRWAEGAPAGEHLRALRTADDVGLFEDEGSLAEPFQALESYARDRARRFVAARAWIREASAEGDALERACCAWDAGLFFEVHEILEPEWLAARSEPREPALQGLIMAGAALYHLSEGNRAGAEGLLAKSVGRLREAPDTLGLDLGAFARGLSELADAVRDGRVTGIGDVSDLPRPARI